MPASTTRSGDFVKGLLAILQGFDGCVLGHFTQLRHKTLSSRFQLGAVPSRFENGIMCRLLDFSNRYG
jgi:hypothetical protein